MEESEEQQKHARQFLLGYLSEAESETVEERLAEPDYLELVLKTENELMEDYIDNELSGDDRRRFEKYVLTNERQVSQLNLSRKLRAIAQVRAAANSPPVVTEIIPTVPENIRESNRSGTDWGFKLSMAAVVLIAVCVTVALIVWRNRSQQSLSEELVRLNTQQSLSSEAINKGFIIGPLKEGLSREDQENRKFSIPAAEEIVQVRLQIGAVPYQTFQAVLETAEGNELLSLNELRARTINGENVVLVYLPVNILTPGDYQIRLSGISQNNQAAYLGRYTFRIAPLKL
jgi:hypothetical protein